MHSLKCVFYTVVIYLRLQHSRIGLFVCFKSKGKAEKARAFKNRQIPSRETLPIEHQLGRFHQTFIAMRKGAIKSDNINQMIQLTEATISTSKRGTATNFQNCQFFYSVVLHYNSNLISHLGIT